MRPIFTASASERVIACPASAALPAAFESSPDADAGTAAHAAIEADIGAYPAILALGDGPPAVEAAFAYDPDADAAAAIGGEGRDYASDGIAGRMDLHWPGVVIDLKTGAQRPGAARDHAQLRTYALMLARTHGLATVDGAIAWVRDGRVEIDRVTFDAFALDDHAAALQRAARRVREARALVAAGGIPDVSPGDHCQWCPALRAGCPAYTALARAASSDLATIAGRLDALSDEDAGAAWLRVAQIKKVLEIVEGSLRARAEQSPIPLGGGKVLKAVPWSRWEKSDAAKGEIKALEDDLRARGEITQISASQVRAVKERS